MWTKNLKIRCDYCGKFCHPVDDYTIYGVKSGTEDNYYGPEPNDPTHICIKCYPEFVIKMYEDYKGGYRNGDWCKSLAETEIAKILSLKWDSHSFKYKELVRKESE